MKRFKIFAVMIVLAVVAGTGVAKSGGGGTQIGWYKWDQDQPYCEAGFFDFDYSDCSMYGYGQTCTIWGIPGFDQQYLCEYFPYSAYYAKRQY